MPSGHFREYILHLKMASRWLHDIVKASHNIRINIECKTTTSCIVRDCIGYNRVSIGRLRTCFGSTLAFYQIRDENRAKMKISYSCGHRVSKSARYDATLNELISICQLIRHQLHSCNTSNNFTTFTFFLGITALIGCPCGFLKVETDIENIKCQFSYKNSIVHTYLYNSNNDRQLININRSRKSFVVPFKYKAQMPIACFLWYICIRKTSPCNEYPL